MNKSDNSPIAVLTESMTKNQRQIDFEKAEIIQCQLEIEAKEAKIKYLEDAQEALRDALSKLQ